MSENRQIVAILTNRTLVFLLLVLSCLLCPSPPVLAFEADQSPSSRFGADLVCTAGDVSITGIAVAPGSPTSCVGGTTIPLDLDITVNFSTPDRWDVGIFLANDGKDPQLLPANGGAQSCTVGILPTRSPFLDLDPNGGLDTCGDGNGAINGGAGSGVVRLENVPVSCRTLAGSGNNLYIPFVVSWDNQSSPSGSNCTSILDPVPNTKSKCNAPNVANPVEVQYGTVNAVVLPVITLTDGVAAVLPGANLTYVAEITNTTGQPLANAYFSAPAAANLNVTGLACSATGGATCPAPAALTVAAMQGAGIAIPGMGPGSKVTFTLSATVADPVSPAYAHLISNTAYVIVAGESNVATDTDDILGAVFSDLSGSTKTVFDLNGGETDPGDVLRYTVTLRETAGIAVSGAAIVDNLPAYVSGLTVVSIPAGAADASTGAGTGSNGTGVLNVTGIDLAANGSTSVVFEVTVTAGTPPGTVIDNTATVSNPGGPGATPMAPSITVSPSAIPKTDNKQLYLKTTSPNTLSRLPPAVPPAAVTFTNAAPLIWTGNNPLPLQLDNTIEAANATLYLSASTTQARQVEARMYCSSNPAAYATSGAYNLGTVPGVPTPYTFYFTSLVGGFSFPATCAAPNYWVLRLDNHTSKDVTVTAGSGGDRSRLNLDSSNVIYVESIGFHDGAGLSAGTVALTAAEETVFIRSVASDPFGSFDITAATVTITDPDGNVRVNAAAMTVLADSGAATKTYQYPYTLPADAPAGNWTVRVDVTEGTEGTVSDYGLAGLPVVAPPTLTVVKSASGPAATPGQVVTYVVQVVNTGAGPAVGVAVSDDLSPFTAWSLDAFGPGQPFQLIQGSPASGLSLGTAEFSRDDGGGWSYTPVSGGGGAATGFDGEVTDWRLPLTGTMPAGGSFTLRYQVMVK